MKSICLINSVALRGGNHRGFNEPDKFFGLDVMPVHVGSFIKRQRCHKPSGRTILKPVQAAGPIAGLHALKLHAPGFPRVGVQEGDHCEDKEYRSDHTSPRQGAGG